jgi:polyisoprenoid-binding protein YceI
MIWLAVCPTLTSHFPQYQHGVAWSGGTAHGDLAIQGMTRPVHLDLTRAHRL